VSGALPVLYMLNGLIILCIFSFSIVGTGHDAVRVSQPCLPIGHLPLYLQGGHLPFVCIQQLKEGCINTSIQRYWYGPLKTACIKRPSQFCIQQVGLQEISIQRFLGVTIQAQSVVCIKHFQRSPTLPGRIKHLCYDCAWLSLTALSTVTCNLWL
jgi:hypothetical protein